MVESSANPIEMFTRIKTDLFHASFLHTLQDHLMCWDPTARAAVDKIYKPVYGVTFDEMLIRNP